MKKNINKKIDDKKVTYNSFCKLIYYLTIKINIIYLHINI